MTTLLLIFKTVVKFSFKSVMEEAISNVPMLANETHTANTIICSHHVQLHQIYLHFHSSKTKIMLSFFYTSHRKYLGGQ